MPLNGKGAFFFLFVTVGEKADIGSPPGQFLRNVVLSHKLEETELVVTDDGFIGFNSQDDSRVLELLNAIFATALTWNAPAQLAHSQRDLCSFVQVDSDRINISRWGGLSGRNTAAIERDINHSNWKQYERFLITPDVLRQLIDRAGQYLGKPNLLKDLLLLAEGWSLQFEQSAKRAAYLYSWMVVETVLEQMWREYVSSLGRTGQDKENLENSRNWTTYHYIETFGMLGRITEQTRIRLNNLRKLRNAVAHDALEPDLQDVKNCMTLAKKMIVNRLDGKSPFDGVS